MKQDSSHNAVVPSPSSAQTLVLTGLPGLIGSQVVGQTILSSEALKSPCTNCYSIFRLYTLLLVSGRIGFIFLTFVLPRDLRISHLRITKPAGGLGEYLSATDC